ncbi:MAG: ABC transporter permease [Acidimicrobiales bacterium]
MSRRWFGVVRLVAARELRERSRAKSFWISTVILVLAVVAGVVIPAAVKGQGSAAGTERVGVVGTNQAAQMALVHTVDQAGAVLAQPVSVVVLSGQGQADAMLRSGSIDLALIGGQEVLLKQALTANDTSSTAALAGALAQLAGLDVLFAELPPKLVNQAASHPVALPVRGLSPAPHSSTARSNSRYTGLVMAILIYVLVLFYGMRLTVGVGEEKSSRIVEVLLSTLRPAQLLAGKVIGVGVLVVGQVVAMVITFLIAGSIVGSSLLHGGSLGVVGLGAMWFILGYAFYSTAFSAAGSLINRQADAFNSALPLLIPLIVAYVLAESLIYTSASPLDKVLGFLPPTAPVMMTMLYAVGAAPAWQVAVSAVICVVGTVGMAKVAGIIYGRAILRTGRRVRLKEVLGVG